jgi:hypothetical protein
MYPLNGEPRCRFLALRPLRDQRAVTVQAATSTLLQRVHLNPARVVHFGTDGAASMLGRKGGAITLLQRGGSPFADATHCFDHRLALAALEAALVVPYVRNTFKTALTSLFYFFDNSSIRAAHLRDVQLATGEDMLRLVKVCPQCALCCLARRLHFASLSVRAS